MNHHYESKFGIGDLVKFNSGLLDTIVEVHFSMRGNVPTPYYLMKKDYDDGFRSGVSEKDIKCKMVEGPLSPETTATKGEKE